MNFTIFCLVSITYAALIGLILLFFLLIWYSLVDIAKERFTRYTLLKLAFVGITACILSQVTAGSDIPYSKVFWTNKIQQFKNLNSAGRSHGSGYVQFPVCSITPEVGENLSMLKTSLECIDKRLKFLKNKSSNFRLFRLIGSKIGKLERAKRKIIYYFKSLNCQALLRGDIMSPDCQSEEEILKVIKFIPRLEPRESWETLCFKDCGEECQVTKGDYKSAEIEKIEEEKWRCEINCTTKNCLI
jgi:hypothetical protein